MKTFTWERAAGELRKLALRHLARKQLDDGQVATLEFIAQRLPRHGVVVADEVGLGKTRIACAAVEAVLRAGGRAAVVVPRGLMHQWRSEYQKLDPERKIQTLSTLRDWVFEEHDPRAVAATSLWLVSHGFEYPAVRSQRDDWKYALPTLVNAQLHPRLRADRRTIQGRMATHARMDRAPWPELLRIAERIARRLGRGHELARTLDGLPWFTPKGSPRGVRESFQAGGASRHAAEQLLGHWLGRFDLVIVDEAHKSRDPAADDETGRERPATKLGRLLELLHHADQRRLCLTATPMELAAGQWGDLVRRTNPQRSPAAIQVAAGRLAEDLTALRRAPDDLVRAEAAIESSRLFEEALEQVVTRRRAMAGEELERRRAEFGAFDASARLASHPHRRAARTAVSLSGSGTHARHARHILVAMEGFSRAAAGVEGGGPGGSAKAAATLYTRIASGHVSADDIERGWIEEARAEAEAAQTLGKLDRLHFWLKELERAKAALAQETRRLGIGNLPVEVVHPRIEATVEAIERWTEGAHPEKVLVFGTFNGPMRHLRDVIEVRHCLREVDAGRPIPIALHRLPDLWPVARWQWRRMHAVKGTFSGRLARRLSTSALSGEVRKAHRRHQARLESIAQAVSAVVRPFVAKHRAASAFMGLERDLGTVLRTRLLHAKGSALGEAPGHKALLAMAQRQLGLMLERAADADERKEDKDGPGEPSMDTLRELVAEELELAHPRQTGYCRVMNGDTGWVVRRTIQDGFNDLKGYPRVLIAQSKVGREGLNLHEACRVLVQFHPEWNPGVVEQQIGRIDRLNSHWLRQHQAWRKWRQGAPPRIEIIQVVFEGTYDAQQREVLTRRTQDFDAALFGSLLPAEDWERVPEAIKPRLLLAAPGFEPERDR